MRSFRNRLLALIIGLIVVTQSVTLVAVLARTAHDVRVRADGQLRAGGQVVQQYLRLRAERLASAVVVLASDFGFREAVAGGDAATMLSAANNHARRIGADLMLLTDTRGRLLAANSAYTAADAATIRELVGRAIDTPEQARFGVLGGHLYQFFLAPVRAPETIGYAAMGFAVDDQLAAQLRDLVDAQISVAAGAGVDRRLMASTLPAAARGGEYLGFAFPLDESAPPVEVVLEKPMDEVLAPYHSQRNALAAISGIALLLAVGIGLALGRGATRPIGDLVRAARRIQGGAYDETVQARGGEEFRSLAATLNAMQRGIAEREARILHDASHDALTGLPNRAWAERRLEELLRTEPGIPAALILIEVANLGEIVASLGHLVGDAALRETAQRLQHNCGAGDLAARLGAAQFLIVARGCTVTRAPLLAEQLAGAVRAGLSLPSVSVELHANAGVCCAPEHGGTAEELMRHVHAALADAGETRGRVALYRAGREAELRRRLALAGDLRSAIEHDGLAVVYQPKVALTNGRVRSLEALVRWTHPQLGAVSPAEFVPIAEQTGGARRLTSWVVGAAIRQMAAWQREGIDVAVAVNLSAPDLLDPQLGDEVLAALARHGVPATRLILEITESALMRDPALAVRHMQLLRVAGVRFSMDDFGTGYSSLSQLSRLPLDELKIDRAFIMHAHERRDDVTIVMSIIELAHHMGLKVVAEGVETREVWELLQRLGCDLAQGYLVSRPLTAPDTLQFLRRSLASAPADETTHRRLRVLNPSA